MSKLLQDVVGELSKLPGVGRRTALRLAIHILRMERDSVAEMTESIDRLAQDGRVELQTSGESTLEQALRSGIMAALCTIRTCRLLEADKRTDA